METVKEFVPFFTGMVLPPILMFIISSRWSTLNKFFGSFVPAILVGATISILMGEVIGADPPEALLSLVIDTALVYTGSQLAYRLAWKGLLEERVRQWRGAPAISPREASK